MVRRIVAREDLVLSEAGSYYPTDSSGWSETAAFNLTPALSLSDVLWSPSSDFAYPSIAPPSSQLYTADTLNQYTPPLSSTSTLPYYNSTDLSDSSHSSSAVDTSLAHWSSTDSVQNAFASLWPQNSASGSHPRGHGSSDLPCYSKSSIPYPCDSDLDSSEYSEASSMGLYGAGTNWHALDELLAAPLSEISFDPTLETTVRLGCLDSSSDASKPALHSSYSLPLPLPSVPTPYDPHMPHWNDKVVL